MIIGVGVDILEIDRVPEKFAERILGKAEKRLFLARNRRKEFIAGRFALKEAFFKALGTGLNGHSFTDVEFLESGGRPVVCVHKDFGFFNYVHVSLSHDRFVVALVVLEKRKGDIIVEGDEDFLKERFEILGRSTEGWEIETSLPPFALKKLLENSNCRLVRYGNILIGE
ncbi:MULTISPECIES: holo-[acyl-carrier-protein] synthase [Thermotoga]|uniref:Holo-[acyl-carrier-protein] synthase n=1 Tax=Thermotoga petrophila (strain ATCC BAA-488 / DSM 13995 / JCM 10881 / RKU-1) TaxID=390874 RepID=A5IJ94_THEP1|nr:MULTISPECIES: holo-[acyl-carrier-protein] synthase [Thermotoga]ABQ46267.1 holo-acyl-carrier-protein synthase [Thermotoga petrophila RKU-1]KAF2959828.1 4'-phosphopantetheinyl transferase [Thermotoga sp. 38H-to]KHC90294.1 4'-phosphopantetheinyl transferase [Thermotoga sp. Mc24]